MSDTESLGDDDMTTTPTEGGDAGGDADGTDGGSADGTDGGSGDDTGPLDSGDADGTDGES